MTESPLHTLALTSQLLERGFLTTVEVRGLTSIKSLIGPSMCGLYILHFTTGELYVGLARDIQKRFYQHRRTYPDIERLSFRTVSLAELKARESEEIAFWKTRARLRNVDELEDPLVERDFDKLVDADFSQRFRTDLDFNDETGKRYQNDTLLHHFTHNRNLTALKADAGLPSYLFDILRGSCSRLRDEG